ncbi:MAG TPA: PAS-domain containing protein, partial [Burkholderiaceae bacterium]|nr:PAS-domain containing protein [Burkholderiaceae bacterium]
MSTPSSPIEDPLKRYRSLQAALDLIDQGFTLIDNDLGLLAWNRSFLRLLDFPDTLAFPGAPFEGFIRYNADRGEYGPGDAAAQVAERVEAARRFESHEFERVRPDGTVLKVRGVPVPGIGFITLYSDITAQKRAERQILEHAAELERRVAERTSELRLSEAQMRLITDSIPALIAYFDHRKAYRYINRGYQDWFGLDPRRLDRVSAREFLGDTTYEAIRPNVTRAFAGEAVTYEYEARCVDGRVRTARTTLIPEKSADGAVVGCFELTFDVSELRRTQQQLAQAEKMEALGQLTGGIAHDFNNMLTVIIGNLGALRERMGDGEQDADFVDPTLAAARRGVDLIRALLGFARRQPLNAGAADIAPLAGTVVKLLRRSMPEGLKLEVDAGEKPLRAWVDASQLQDALVNMILNARDAKASRVTVRTAP